jgi:hypothetical protein
MLEISVKEGCPVVVSEAILLAVWDVECKVSVSVPEEKESVETDGTDVPFVTGNGGNELDIPGNIEPASLGPVDNGAVKLVTAGAVGVAEVIDILGLEGEVAPVLGPLADIVPFVSGYGMELEAGVELPEPVLKLMVPGMLGKELEGMGGSVVLCRLCDWPEGDDVSLDNWFVWGLPVGPSEIFDWEVGPGVVGFIDEISVPLAAGTVVLLAETGLVPWEALLVELPDG